MNITNTRFGRCVSFIRTAALVAALMPNIGKADEKDVLTQHNDNWRTGHYTAETVLTPSFINSGQFGSVATLNLQDSTDQIYAQPLYVHALALPNQGSRNVLFVATEKNWIYAFDADQGSAVNVWPPIQLGSPVKAENIGGGYYTLYPLVGITSTPVIDRMRNRLYTVSESDPSGNGAKIQHTISAIDITTGLVVKSQLITGSVPGTGGGANPNGTLPFDPLHHINRASLLLQDATIYVAFAGAFEQYPYHGWVFGFDADTLAPVGTYAVNRNGDGGGIWQSGNGLAGDGNAIYAATGNGGNDTAKNTQTDPDYYGADDPRGSGIVKLGPSLQEEDWFVPHNQQCLDSCDLDLSTGGPVLLPGLQRLLVGGKEGRFYLLDTSNLGKGPQAADNQVKQCFRATPGLANPSTNLPYYCEPNVPPGSMDGPCPIGNPYDKTEYFGQIHGTPVVWTQTPGAQFRIFVQGEYDYLKAFQYENAEFVDRAKQPLMCALPTQIASPVDQSTDQASLNTTPGGILSLSSNGQQAGSVILWVSTPKDPGPNNNGEDAQHHHLTGLLRAYDASNLRSKLWEQQLDTNGFIKFVPPTIANGKVYMAEIGRIQVSGALPTRLPPPYQPPQCGPGEKWCTKFSWPGQCTPEGACSVTPPRSPTPP